MPINATYEYFEAEKKYLSAKTLDEKIICLEEMIKAAPKHKGAENLLKELRVRLKKLKEKSEISKKGSGNKKGIRKDGFQIILLGLPNSGKSSLLSCLTNATPKIASFPFSTTQPEIGTLNHKGIKAQIIDLPSVGSENLDRSLIHTADLLLTVIESLSDIEKLSSLINFSKSKKIYIVTKSDSLSENEKRKISETLKSKKLPGLLISSVTKENILQLKDLILENMSVVRVYTKEPGKPPSKDPIVLRENSTVKDAAEEIRKGFSAKIKETKVTGPSAKFANQKVGLSHILKDKDIIEFHMK